MQRVYKVGWKRITGKGGVLEIVAEDNDNLYLVCSRCHEDSELFPLPITKPKRQASDLKTRVPCSCSNTYVWTEDQRRIQILRLCADIGYIFHGFVGKFKGNKTYLDLENPETGNRWDSCCLSNFLNNGRRDPSDVEYRKLKEVSLTDRVDTVERILRNEGIPQKITIHALSDIKMSYTSFNWVCIRGHRRVSTFNNFINHNQRCGDCHRINNSFSGFVNGVYEGRTYDNDFLYILRFEGVNETFIKIGRTFNLERRMVDTRSAAKGYSVSLIYLEQNLHFQIVERESYLLNKTKHLHYMPKNRFEGWSECRSVIPLEDIVIG